ncbi:hypothetical protein ACFL1Y_00350 [Patescibacteria group bacterium]
MFNFNTSLLKPSSTPESLIIAKTKGNRIISDQTKMFNAWIDPDFNNWKADEPGQNRPKTKVNIYEVIGSGTYSDLFNSLNNNIKDLCLTQSQIISFIQKYQTWLKKERLGTFFLFESYDCFFVARIYMYPNRSMSVGLDKFENSNMRHGYSHRQIITF